MKHRSLLRLLPALPVFLAAGAAADAQTLPADPVTATEEARLEALDALPFAMLGYGASVDDGRIVVGSVGDVDSGWEGAVHLFELGPGGWAEKARIRAPGVPPLEQQFWVLDIDGDTLAADGTALGVHVFIEGASGWVEEAVLPRPPGEAFGSCLALEGDTLVVGAPWADARTGAVYVFTRRAGAWSLQARLTASDGMPDDLLGTAAALDGDRLVVGAPTGDGIAPDTGAAYVWERVGTAWGERAKLIDPLGHPAPSSLFGHAVSAYGDRLAVGAWGSAHVFVRDGTGWSVEAYLFSLDPQATDLYGMRLALHGERLVVGAWQHLAPGATHDRGEAYLLERVGGIWRQRAALTGSGSSSGSLASALDFDGRFIVLGDPDDHGVTTFAGTALVYSMREMPEVYCSGKPGSLGCAPRVAVSGRARVSGTEPFRIRGLDTLPDEAGILLYGSGRLGLPFHGGTLCVKSPIVRWLPPRVAQSSGSPPCPGVLSADFNTRIRSGADPGLTAGRSVFVQWLQRDPADPAGFGDGLSDAVGFRVGP